MLFWIKGNLKKIISSFQQSLEHPSWNKSVFVFKYLITVFSVSLLHAFKNSPFVLRPCQTNKNASKNCPKINQQTNTAPDSTNGPCEYITTLVCVTVFVFSLLQHCLPICFDVCVTIFISFFYFYFLLRLLLFDVVTCSTPFQKSCWRLFFCYSYLHALVVSFLCFHYIFSKKIRGHHEFLCIPFISPATTKLCNLVEVDQ